MTPDWIAPNRTAVLLIDMQVDFGAPDGEMARRGADIGPAQAALAKAQELAQAARAAGVAVVFVRLVNDPDKQTRVAREAQERHGADGPGLCLAGSPGADFTGPQPQPGDQIVTKPLFSAFHGTALAQQLHREGIDTVVLGGLTTECCVQSSAWSAFEEDFHVFIAQDACAAYEKTLHDQALKGLGMSGAIIAPVAEFAAGWKSYSVSDG